MVKNWYEEHETELKHMEWPPQSPDLSIIKHLWCILERQVRNRYETHAVVFERPRTGLNGRMAENSSG